MSRRIDYYFTLTSPWAYIGHRPFMDLARRRGVSIVYRPVALNEVFAETGGLPLPKRHPARQAYRMMELQRWREKRGLPFRLKPKHWPFEADPANRAVLAIAGAGGDPGAFVQSAFSAIWEQDEDLADPRTLQRLLSASGHDAEAVVSTADSPKVRATYEQNRLDAITAGVFGSPSYVLDEEVFWGQDRLDLLEDALTSGRRAYGPTPAGR
ncbi:MAG TPA: 2-hydroxychromene-2-carboxylate isomerase [Roseiarcus sp.]|nr:2-hydroxychromene-2-carboxylate isomerase [Roseiarcus sp.]